MSQEIEPKTILNANPIGKDKPNVPALRFKQFQNVNLRCMTFNDVANYKKGPFGSSLKKEFFVKKSETTVKVYEQQNIINKNYQFERYFISDSYYDKLKSFEVHSGDIIVSCAGTIGEIYTLPSDAPTGVINQALMRIRPHYELIDHDYFIYSFDKMIDSFSFKYSNGSAIKNIPPFVDLKAYRIYIPNIIEQKKISVFLKLIDNKISTQKKIIENMQSLINQIKAKTFDKVSGNVTSLKEIIEESDIKSTVINQYPIISSTVKGLYLQSEYFVRTIASKNNIGYKVIGKNEIIISPQNLWMGNITYNDKYENGIVSPSYKIYRVNHGYDSRYVYEMLTTKKSLFFYKIISEQGASVVRRNLNMKEFIELTFKVPKLSIQKQIMKVLKSLEMKLKNEKEILSLYDKQKHCFLNGLFI